MEVWSVTDPLFREYGRIVEGLPTASRLLARLAALTPVPEGVEYVASDAALEALPEAAWLREHVFGGMPIQLGWCNGHNSRLNCLEYHRDSEVDAGATDFILLLAKREQIVAHSLDTSKVRAFFCPAGTIVELYATSIIRPAGYRRMRAFRCSASCRAAQTEKSLPFLPKVRRIRSSSPATNGFWPIRRVRRQPRARTSA